MANYMLTYLGGEKPSSPEEVKQHFGRYMEWLSSLGAAAVSPAGDKLGWAHTQRLDKAPAY